MTMRVQCGGFLSELPVPVGFRLTAADVVIGPTPCTPIKRLVSSSSPASVPIRFPGSLIFSPSRPFC